MGVYKVAHTGLDGHLSTIVPIRESNVCIWSFILESKPYWLSPFVFDFFEDKLFKEEGVGWGEM